MVQVQKLILIGEKKQWKKKESILLVLKKEIVIGQRLEL